MYLTVHILHLQRQHNLASGPAPTLEGITVEFCVESLILESTTW